MGFRTNYKGLRGYCEMAKGNKAAAEKNLSWAYEHGLTKPAYLTAYGALLMQQKNYQKCLEVYTRAVQNTPENSGFMPTIKASIITCRYKLGQQDDSILEDARALYEEHKSSTIYMLYGYLLMRAGKLEEALKINLEGYEYDDKDASLCDNLGQTYYLMGDTENAKKYFTQAVNIKYNMVDSCYFLAEIYMAEDNIKKAYDLLDDAKDAPFSALTTVTREQINENYELAEKILKEHII